MTWSVTIKHHPITKRDHTRFKNEALRPKPTVKLPKYKNPLRGQLQFFDADELEQAHAPDEQTNVPEEA